MRDEARAEALSHARGVGLLTVPASREAVYVPAATGESLGTDDGLLRAWAPVVSVEEGERDFNRIGTPFIRRKRRRDHVRIDVTKPALFAETRSDRIGSLDVLHLVYRMHFTRLAFTPRVFYEWHRNAGLLALVTLDAGQGVPLVFTTVYTCGCYRVVVPTDRLNRAALPPAWPASTVHVWGATLPSTVPAALPGRSRFFIHLASHTHRVDTLGITPLPPLGGETAETIDTPLRPLPVLRGLPVPGEARTASMFHTRGLARGHVRGAFSPIEGLTAGLLLLDPMLGMDKDLGEPAVTGTSFYTNLLPWRRDVSRLDRFEPLLRMLGFDVERFSASDPSS